MTIGLDEEHVALAASVRGWAGRHARRAEPEPAAAGSRPAGWPEFAAQGLLAVHLPVEYGGAGAGALELAVIFEELGRALASGPALSTVLASAAIAAGGSAARRAELLPGLADGSRVAAVVLERVPVGRPDLLVLGPPDADTVLVPGPDGGWSVVPGKELTIEPVPGLDLGRPLGRIRADSLGDEAAESLGPVPVRALLATLAAAEAAGIAAWCVETAAEHARTRVQFGRPIGQFQAVKHTCARMLLDATLAEAVAWDAARAYDGHDPEQRDLAAGVAAVIALEAACRCAKDCIQVLGGTGFTWEHDAHRYLRRALSLRALVDPPGWARRVVALTGAGVVREVALDLPAGAEAIRAEIRPQVAALAAAGPAERAELLATGGWVVPHLPRPWGRAAGPVEQLVVEQELARAGVPVPNLVVGNWVVPTIALHGDRSQQNRFLPATLRGELTWCQLFSEPGAGSDLASLATRAERVDGGWRLTGQKVWTSLAHLADWGACLARTDPAVAKHRGIGYFLVDMRSPGITVRPLRELTGEAQFNEVFLDEVFVPDGCLVGGPGDGWRLALTTLTHERVSLSTGWARGAGVAELLQVYADTGATPSAGLAGLICAEQAFAVLGLRANLRLLAGADPGAMASVRKLLGIRHSQRVAEHGLALLGPWGAVTDPASGGWPELVLGVRAMSIAGGTTEIQLNIIAERLLGLPRDP